MPLPVNRVYYGPPGTGKTYRALRDAVELVLGKPCSEQLVVGEYLRLVEQGQIFPITFHPSYSYEDFVEGFRPRLKDGQLVYAVQHGPLRLAIDACRESSRRVPGAEFARHFRVGQELGRSYTVTEVFPSGVVLESTVTRKNRITPTLINFVDFWSIRRFMDLDLDPQLLSGAGQKNELRQEFTRLTGMPSTFTTNAGSHRAVYEYLLGRSGDHVESVDSSADDEQVEDWSGPLEGESSAAESGYVTGNSEVAPRPVVILIDEINRADIAVVFGELMTLIEVDKRQGCQEERLARLPYSGDVVAVPSSLHFIGTMNTADKSISSIDLAMRRRFDWRIVEPEPNLCPGSYGGIDVAAALRRWNGQIGLLLGPDLMFGHAEFMESRLETTRIQYEWPDTDDGRRRALAAVIRSKLLPSLIDCFSADWQRVRLVLGPSLVRVAQRMIGDSDEEGEGDLEGEFAVSSSGALDWWNPTSVSWDGPRLATTLGGPVGG